MTEDLSATYSTISALQERGDYDEITQIAQFAIDAIVNDGEVLRLKLSIGLDIIDEN
jgi:hypothetical protein